MRVQQIYLKRALCALFFFGIFFLSSCQQKCCEVWSVDTVDNPCQKFKTKRLLLCKKVFSGAMVVELIKTCDGVSMFLTVKACKFPSLDKDFCKTPVCFIQGSCSQEFVADRLLGGQKLLVPEETMQWLIEKLLNGETFVLKTGRYSVEVVPTDFARKYREFMSN